MATPTCSPPPPSSRPDWPCWRPASRPAGAAEHFLRVWCIRPRAAGLYWPGPRFAPVPAEVNAMWKIPWFRWGAVLGFALGGFFDGILLHQILQWHHLLSLVPGIDD